MPIQRLILEGENDKHVIANLFKVLAIPDPIDYTQKEAFWSDFLKADRQKGGKTEALKLFKRSLKEELDNLGLIVDADESAQNTWQSIRGHLLNAGFSEQNLPINPATTGTIVRQLDKPTVGVWIMPDNQRPESPESGHFYLEHFYESLIRTDDALLLEAHQTIEKIMSDHNDNPIRFRNVHHQKAKIHTWLSWIDEPGGSLGRTLQSQRLFDYENPILSNFIHWYRATFQL